ncbi:unnamed protein product [Urochloa decumbens]|uniref:F-box domain-containing protein n=1 Tax=Urochloa decumbens TaxID=240449 RepID=A0ABC8VWH1_9POAL
MLLAPAPPPAAQPPLPDELLEDIFLRLDAAEDLARAASSCASFHRVVSARGFLRRFRSLHQPPVLGFIDSNHGATRFYQAQPPRKSAPAARAFAQAADFTFSFLANPSRWRVRDTRDGRVLLARPAASFDVFDEFVVYDPLHRRHFKIPPIPGDLTAFTAAAGNRSYESYFEPFLAPAGREEEESSLRVFCNVMSKTKIVTFVFSLVTGMWQAVASFSIGTHEWKRYGFPIFTRRHCAHGCFYWTDYCMKVMLVLDTLEMEFSLVDLPPESKGKDKSIVEVAEGRFGLLILDDFKFHLYSKARRSNGAGAEEWRHDNVIPLPDRYWSISIYGAAEGYVLVRGIPQDQYNSWKSTEKKPDAQYFTLEVKALLFERLCVLKFETCPDYLYASFPPPLSPPSI